MGTGRRIGHAWSFRAGDHQPRPPKNFCGAALGSVGMLTTRDVVALEVRGPARVVKFGTARRSPPTPWSWPHAVETTRTDHRGVYFGAVQFSLDDESARSHRFESYPS